MAERCAEFRVDPADFISTCHGDHIKCERVVKDQPLTKDFKSREVLLNPRILFANTLDRDRQFRRRAVSCLLVIRAGAGVIHKRAFRPAQVA